MKEGWRYCTIGEICDILDSKRKPIKKNKRISGDIPYYGATGVLDYVKDFIFDEPLVLLGEDGAKWGVGDKSAYKITGKSWVNNHAHALRPHRDIILDDFLIFYLNYSDLSDYITGVTVPKLNQEKMRGIIIPIPPISEQQRIVSFLDAQFAKIDAIKANAEKQLQEAKALFQNALKDLLTPKEGWEEKLLKNILLDSENIRWQDVDKNKEYGYIDLTSVSRETKEVISPSIINSSNAPSRAKQIVKSGDLIFATTRPTLRRFCLISDVYDSQICSTGFCLLRPNKQILSSFLFYILFSDDFYFYIEPLQTGASYPAVSDNIVKNYTIYLPSILEQEKIVEKLDELREKITQLQSNYSQIVTLCEDLKKSLLKDIFS